MVKELQFSLVVVVRQLIVIEYVQVMVHQVSLLVEDAKEKKTNETSF
jgi:hypothetical protein